MKTTTSIKLALADEAGFINLLVNYGRWSRYFGGVGYKSTQPRPSYIIDDETALCIDKAMCRLKAMRPNLYKIIEYWYIRELDEGDILSLVKSDERVPFKIDKKTRKFLRYLNLRDVRELIAKAEELVKGYLSES